MAPPSIHTCSASEQSCREHVSRQPSDPALLLQRVLETPPLGDLHQSRSSNVAVFPNFSPPCPLPLLLTLRSLQPITEHILPWKTPREVAGVEAERMCSDSCSGASGLCRGVSEPTLADSLLLSLGRSMSSAAFFSWEVS